MSCLCDCMDISWSGCEQHNWADVKHFLIFFFADTPVSQRPPQSKKQTLKKIVDYLHRIIFSSKEMPKTSHFWKEEDARIALVKLISVCFSPLWTRFRKILQQSIDNIKRNEIEELLWNYCCLSFFFFFTAIFLVMVGLGGIFGQVSFQSMEHFTHPLSAIHFLTTAIWTAILSHLILLPSLTYI